MAAIVPLMLLATWAHAQSWPLTGFDPTFPRISHEPAQLPDIRQGLKLDPLKNRLFEALCNNLEDTVYYGTTDDMLKRNAAAATKNVAFCLLVDCYQEPSTGVFYAPLPDSLRLHFIRQAYKGFATLNVVVPSIVGANYGNFDDWQWPAKMLLNYTQAYDMLMSTPGIPDSVRQVARAQLLAFTQQYWQRATEPAISSASFFDLIQNNHALMTGAALATAAIALADSAPQPGSFPAQILHKVLPTCANIFWEGLRPMSMPDTLAGYAEGPHYLRYSFQHLFLLHRGLARVAPDQIFALDYNGAPYALRHPYYDPRYLYLYDWAVNLLTPQAKLPPLEDSFTNLGFPELALSGQSQYHVHIYAYDSSAQSAEAMNQELKSRNDLRAEYLLAQVPVRKLGTKPKLLLMPAAGNAIFRSGDSLNATYFSLLAEHGPARVNGGGHDQGDVASFHMEHKGAVLAHDPGYVQWSERWRVNDGQQHNTVLVNNCGPQGSVGVSSLDADGYLVPVHNLPGLRAVEAQAAYCNATLARRVYWLEDENLFIIRDFCTAPAGARFTFQLHGNGLRNAPQGQAYCQADTVAGTAQWHNARSGLSTLSVADDLPLTYSTKASPHETGYLAWADHTTYLATTPSTVTAQFTSVLCPHDSGAAPALQALALPGNMTGMRIGPNGWLFSNIKGFPVVNLPSQTGLPAELSTDARWCYFRRNATTGSPDYLWLEAGRLLRLGGKPLADMSQPQSLLLHRTAPNRYDGWLSGLCTLSITMPHPLIAANGNGLLSASYDATTGRADLTFVEGGFFTLLIDQSIVTAIAPQTGAESVPVLYPQPAGDAVWLRFAPGTQPTEAVVCQVFDLSGRQVMAPVAAAEQGDAYRLDISSLANGLYVLEATGTTGATHRLRLLVQR